MSFARTSSSHWLRRCFRPLLLFSSCRRRCGGKRAIAWAGKLRYNSGARVERTKLMSGNKQMMMMLMLSPALMPLLLPLLLLLLMMRKRSHTQTQMRLTTQRRLLQRLTCAMAAAAGNQRHDKQAWRARPSAGKEANGPHMSYGLARMQANTLSRRRCPKAAAAR